MASIVSQTAASPDSARVVSGEAPPAGGTRSLSELHRLHCQRLLRFFARHGARQDADDLTQESFARLAKARISGAKPIEKPDAYLSRIASNLLRDRAKVALRRSLANHVPADDVPLAGEDPVAALEVRDQLQRIEASLARLSPKTRWVFLAHRREGMSYKDIANQTGLSVKAVERRMSKAIAHIDRALRAHRDTAFEPDGTTQRPCRRSNS